MLNLSGDEKFEQPPEILWQSLARPDFLCRCFPDVDRVVKSDERTAAVVVRPGFSFVRGTLDVSFDFAELDPPRLARVRIHVKGVGSSAELAMQLDIAAVDGGSVVRWRLDAVQFGGLLKAVSMGLVLAAAQKVAADTWGNIRKQLSK
jgi:carbon monoxide dehydrogenase subunit G